MTLLKPAQPERTPPIESHPCWFPLNGPSGTLSHRAFVTREHAMYCERCGTQLDFDKKQLSGAPLCWGERLPSTSGAITTPMAQAWTDYQPQSLYEVSRPEEAGRWASDLRHAFFSGCYAMRAHAAPPTVEDARELFAGLLRANGYALGAAAVAGNGFDDDPFYQIVVQAMLTLADPHVMESAQKMRVREDD